MKLLVEVDVERERGDTLSADDVAAGVVEAIERIGTFLVVDKESPAWSQDSDDRLPMAVWRVERAMEVRRLATDVT